MSKKKRPRPTESELEILQVLWEQGPSSVRAVNELLNERRSDRSIGYTTTLKLMQIMADKELVVRDTTQRTHIYAPLVSEEDVQHNLLKKFLDTTFRGSAAKLVMQALGSHQATPEELDEIKSLIREMEKRQSPEE